MALGYAYAALGVNGLTKVGRTINPKRRTVGLKKEFKAKGDILSKIEFFDPTHNAYGFEASLILHCRGIYTPHSGREWFTGCDFRALVDHARKLVDRYRDWKAPRRMTEKKRAELKARWAAQNEAKRAIREKALLDRALRAAIKRERKSKPERIMAAIVSFAMAASRARA